MFASKDLTFAKTTSSGYQISRSLRFRSSASAYLNRTFGTATDPKKWTFSCWAKGSFYNGTTYTHLFGTGAGSTDTTSNQFIWANTGSNLAFSLWSINVLITNAVYRDPSAWYHVMLVMDNANATISNRAKIYVNGVEATYSTDNRASLSTTTNYAINSAILHTVGRWAWNSFAQPEQFDGYLAETYFIDGQALTPSSFGAYDTNGVWQPARYTGSYTGNSFYLPFSATPTSSFAASFNGSTQYLTTATNAGLGLGTSDFTVEYWMNTTTAVNGATLCCAGTGTVSYDGLFGYITSGSLVTYLSSTGSSWDVASNRIIISSITLGRWYHIAITRNGSTWRVFVDGTQVDTFTSSASLYQSANQFILGRAQGTGYFTGQLSNVRVIKGTALYTSNFTPSSSPLTAVTNTQLLCLQSSSVTQDNGPNNLTITNTGTVSTSTVTPWANYIAGQDISGIGNGWISNNINVTTTGTTYDSMIDVPINYDDATIYGRGNYCVGNPLDKSPNITLNNGNLNYGATTTAWKQARSTISIPETGKWYFEITATAISNGDYMMLGFSTPSSSLSTYPGGDATGDGFQASGHHWGNGTFYSGGGPAYTTNDVVMLAVDRVSQKIWVGKNGTWSFSGNPAAGTGAVSSTYVPTTGAYFLAIGLYTSGESAVANFGQRPFTYTPPSGFLALNTQNLPTPTIANGAQNMAATIYAGNNSSQSINNGTNNTIGTTFQPDFVWVKNRTNANDHILVNSIVGANINLYSNRTNAQVTNNNGGYINSFNVDGFTPITGSTNALDTNATSNNYVGWQWKAGGTGVTNTSGSITSTVSANVAAGFSVVTWTATNTANQSIGHGLGATPSMIITKDRDNGPSFNWAVWFTGFNANEYILLNTTGAKASFSSLWYSVPDSTKFYVGSTGTGINNGTDKNVAYCFAPVAGYSAFGSYTGNGSTDGPFVYTGFRPRWILAKRTDTTSDWRIHDTSRATYNVDTIALMPNLSSAEDTGSNNIDVLSNGFKMRDAGGFNISNGTYIYAAFAENPFKISRAR